MAISFTMLTRQTLSFRRRTVEDILVSEKKRLAGLSRNSRRRERRQKLQVRPSIEIAHVLPAPPSPGFPPARHRRRPKSLPLLGMPSTAQSREVGIWCYRLR